MIKIPTINPLRINYLLKTKYKSNKDKKINHARTSSMRRMQLMRDLLCSNIAQLM